jgi:RND family efflux transporter MFP subunit
MMAEPRELHESLAALRLERRPAPVEPRRRRLPLVMGAIAALLVVGLAIRWVRGTRAPAVEVVRATVLDPGAGVAVLSGAGYVVSADRYISIGARVPGRIDRYFAEEGDHVKAGDPLVQLDARDYAAMAKRAEATLAHAQADAALKHKQLERARQLAGSGVISRDELDVRSNEVAVADAAVGQAQAELAQARVNLEYTTLYAPRSGVILAKLKEVGEIAVPGGFSGSGDLIRMANLEGLRGQLDVTEGELAKVRMKQRAEVVPDAYPDRRYAASVVKLYPQIDRTKGTLRVEVKIENPDDYLWPDMSVRITFFEDVAAPDGGRVVLVPRTAVHEESGAASVWTVSGDTVHRVAVTVGARLGEQVQIASGLLGDETLVVGDTTALRDGHPVRVGG